MVKSQLEDLYKTNIRSELVRELGLKNVMQTPSISKIVVNIGIKDAVSDSKVVTQVKDIIEKITGQCAVKTIAKKSIASFKLRKGMPIGVCVTLRRNRMYHFLNKLINVVLPAVRDFQGISAKFDGRGNYNLGINDWIYFPEVDYDKIDKSRGLNITIQTTAKTDEHAYALLKKFNVPFKKKD